MTTRPEGRPGRGVGGDERGAILVMGIFMCACLVGILWYLAGIGDAVVFRERMPLGPLAESIIESTGHADSKDAICIAVAAMRPGATNSRYETPLARSAERSTKTPSPTPSASR